jgi:hypothetical protein
MNDLTPGAINEARTIDYRDAEEIPALCKYCGGRIQTATEEGNVYISGSADLKWAAKYGITTEGLCKTLWTKWWCENAGDDAPHEHGPILLGSHY